MNNLAAFYRKYDTELRELTIHGRKFKFVVPKTLDDFIDLKDVTRDFPLWAKIWEASWVLAEFFAHHPPQPSHKILEVGAGIGVVGIVASSFGHNITLTEYNQHALRFATANAVINDCRDIRIVRLDWRKPTLQQTFDSIIGSEITYHEKDFRHMCSLFSSYLKPHGQIMLSLGVRRDGLAMVGKLHQFFNVRTKKYRISSADEAISVILCRLTPKT